MDQDTRSTWHKTEPRQRQAAPLPRVVIVGAGFDGLQAARALGKLPVQLTVIDCNNYHLFQPLLYHLALQKDSLRIIMIKYSVIF